MEIIVLRKVSIPLEAAESYTKKAFGLVVKLSEMFDFSKVAELLGSVQWTKVLPVFIPQGVDNRRAVDSLVTVGFKKPYEEEDVMQYKGSEGSDKPRLYLVNWSVRPDVDTMGVSPNNLVKMGKLWLPLKGYAIAQGLNYEVMSDYLDPETWNWFPGETLPGGRSVYGRWNPDDGVVRFYWGNSGYEFDCCGARLAIPVPLVLKP